MSLRVAPHLPVPSNPCVGVFWVLANTLLIDRSTLAEAESYEEGLQLMRSMVPDGWQLLLVTTSK